MPPLGQYTFHLQRPLPNDYDKNRQQNQEIVQINFGMEEGREARKGELHKVLYNFF